jgi:hypothetical protein
MEIETVVSHLANSINHDGVREIEHERRSLARR